MRIPELNPVFNREINRKCCVGLNYPLTVSVSMSASAMLHNIINMFLTVLENQRSMGLTGLKHQNACKDRTPLLFPAIKHLCSSRHSPLLQLAAQRPSLSLVPIHHHPCGHVDLTHTAQDHGSSVESPACVSKVPIPQEGPYSRGSSEDAENLRFYDSIAHTHLSHLILHSWKAGTENDSCLEFQSFVSFCLAEINFVYIIKISLSFFFSLLSQETRGGKKPTQGFLCSFGACSGACSVDQAGLELTEIACLCLPNVGIKGVRHHYMAS